ncbi:hydantoinase B/oxoprolinase family protein [Streptomyces sp. NPDC085946]|uniref:hydantoinase B/oxoprolinase family protein n=1 Tax=Streptomyces sp. NPDC085946 TaxID=3365744 RepID=UPI0037CE7AD3
MTGTTPRYATEDGVLRNPQVDFEALGEGPWDGIHRSYIPRPELSIDPGLALHTEADLQVDPITYQVLRSRLWHQNLEHGDIIQRVTGSPPVIYSKDFATAVLTEDGEVVTVSPTIQFFSTLADLVVKWTLEHRGTNPDIGPGDVFLQNSPFVAAGQQPDTAVFAPVFHDGKLFAWVYNALHMGDLGGVDPGGWAVHARDKFEDGAATAPVKIVDGGRIREDVLALWVNQGRDPGTLRLNVNSGIAGCRAMVERVTGLADEYGPTVVKSVMRRMIADCSRVVGERLLRIPDGTWSQRLYVSGALGEDHRLHQEVLTITKRGERIVCSNAGTSPQGGPGNSTYSVLRSAVVAALASAVGWDQQGCMAGIADHVVMEPVFGTRSCANPPAATSALHSVFVTMNLAGLTTGAMLMSGPPDLRERATASRGLSVAMADIGFGLDENMSLVAPPVSLHGGLLGGGIGAFPHRDGMDNAGSWFMLGTSAGNIEPIEQDGVGLVLYRRELRDGGGPGRWRGGNGTEAAWIPHHAFMSNAQMVFVEPSANLAAGLAGGYYALAGNFMRSTGGAVARAMADGRVPGDREQLEQATGRLERLHPQAVLMPVPPGDAVVVEHNGGGGFGDPLDREPERVAADVAHGRVSVGAARKYWGVVLDTQDTVDASATAALRREIRRERLESAVAPQQGTPRPEGSLEVVLPGAGGSVDLARVSDTFGWACSGCGHWLADAGTPFQNGAAVAEQAPHEVDSRLYPDPAEFGDPSLLLRRYHCPSCAALLSQQFCRREDGPGSTLHLELATLQVERTVGG